MNKQEKETDWLKPLFRRLPAEELPASFREALMGKILRETAKRKKTNERFELLAVLLASLGMMGLAIGAILWAGPPRMVWRTPEWVSLPFYSYIGVLLLLLLGGDHWLRRAYRKRHPD
ncbi:MAG: hypothetical protein LBD89_04480 [Tannerellaceae bacterium]|jgi:hypothetical protein|nr:hypothetical protein [Tannerellaceae bacterium]